jgi:HlyD family secretion protein
VVVVVQWVIPAFTDSSTFTLSGTIEATEIHLASQISGRVQEVYAREGDHVTTGEKLINIYSTGGGANDEITSPIDGTVMERLIEPGELAAPGSPLMVVADLDTLTLTVYVPEDRYGEVYLGKTYPVSVDSFPNETFVGKVSHIADQAEYTPRNVQTVDGRKSTVFAIKLDLAPSGGKLKPGMPADVAFSAQ